MPAVPIAITAAEEESMARVHPEIMRVWPLIQRDFQADTGLRVVLVSGFRPRAQQATLYSRYKRGLGGRAAPPGQSAHQYGLAIDGVIIPSDKSVDKWSWATSSFWGRRAYRKYHSIAARYGLESIVATAPDDPFHLQAPHWRRLAGIA